MALQPTHRGFAWVAFEGPFTPYDWGMVEPKRKKNEKCLRALEKLLARLTPETLLLEAFERPNALRNDRIGRLCRAMMALADSRGAQVAIYSRGDVRACFASVGARTRYEIAAAIARHLEAFRHRLPKRPQAWESADRRLSLFAAVALVLTHYQLDAGRVFDDLKLDQL